MLKLKVQSINEACDDCPFYKQTTKGKYVCAFKQLLTPAVTMAVMESTDHVDDDLWDIDCKGSYDNCAFTDIFFDCNEDSDPEENSNEDFDDFDPFGDGEEEEDERVQEEDEPAKTTEEAPHKIITKDDPKSKVNVSVRQVEQPFRVKSDVLIYPTNNMLEIDSLELIRLSGGRIQRLCDAIFQKYKINMGEVYPTTNGSTKDFTSGVAPKHIYHSVIAGQSKLVNEADMKKSMLAALKMADNNGAQVVVVYPFDCGLHDISQTAVAQLSSIKLFLKVHPTKSLKNIYVVMEDVESLRVYEKYYKRIFK